MSSAVLSWTWKKIRQRRMNVLLHRHLKFPAFFSERSRYFNCGEKLVKQERRKIHPHNPTWLAHKKDDLAFVMVLFSTCRIRDFFLLVSRKNTVKEERRWKKFGKISNANLCFDNKQHHSNFWNRIKMRRASALCEILRYLQISFLFVEFMVLYAGKD